MRVSEIRELNPQELNKELADQERAMMNLRFRQATLQLSDSNQIGKTRRTIARIKTVMRERAIAAELQSQAQGG
ncbi:MAG: 50S ribosomal protein L29 [Dehalococcoidia bacterium]